VTFAEWLDAQMLERGLTQAELASKVGVSQQAVSLWLQGERSPGVRSVNRLARLFEAATDRILELLDGFEWSKVPS
jgi:repressor LexA